MAQRFLDVDRATPYLLPPSVDEWIEAKHLARFVVDVVDQLDLSALERRYSGRGKKAYHPSVLVAVLFYGYATGVYSSRALERASYDSVAFRYLCANLHPDHDTLAEFRKGFRSELSALFVQILGVAQQMGMLKVGQVALDGTKIKANASAHKALSWKHALKLEAQLKAEVAELLKKAERADASELPDGLDIPAELARREDRLKGIAAAKAEIERRAQAREAGERADYQAKMAARKARAERSGRKPGGREPQPPQSGPTDKDQVNLTDAESRILPAPGGGFVQGYNAQAAVDIDSRLIVARHLTTAANDKRELIPALEQLRALPKCLGQVTAVVADNGYLSSANVTACGESSEGHAPITPSIALSRESHHLPLLQRFAPTPPEPAEDADAMTRMAWRLKTPQGNALYGLRKQVVEPVFGIIKQTLRMRQFLLRGQAKVSGEWDLVCMGYNLKRMHLMMA
jgi:transposase